MYLTFKLPMPLGFVTASGTPDYKKFQAYDTEKPDSGSRVHVSFEE
jgi:hypothetical protein